MMKTEYEQITKVTVTQAEYTLIENLYMDSSLDKYEFCKKVANVKFLADLRYIKVLQLEKKIAEIEMYAKAQKVTADFSYNHEGNKEAEKPVKEAFPEGSNSLYAYNRRLMGLAVSIEMNQVIHIIERKD